MLEVLNYVWIFIWNMYFKVLEALNYVGIFIWSMNFYFFNVF
jgi:hypothetical protein